jgi:hypothetical protein
VDAGDSLQCTTPITVSRFYDVFFSLLNFDRKFGSIFHRVPRVFLVRFCDIASSFMAFILRRLFLSKLRCRRGNKTEYNGDLSAA